MDLTTVSAYRRATSDADLTLAPGERYLAGGTWMFSEPNRDVTGLVDVTTLPGPHLTADRAGLTLGPGCTIARLLALEPQPGWTAQPLFRDAANALLAGFKIWNEATVLGNIARAFAAGAMTAACATLDADATVRGVDGGRRTVPVASLPTGNGTTVLGHGELIESVRIGAEELATRTALRKVALAELGRSGAVVSGRAHADGRTVIVVTAATLTPHVLRFDAPPRPDDAADAARSADDFYTDPLGAADWRRHVAGALAARVATDLAHGDEEDA
ncbi:FAD binding domain-containing protein [Demequina sp. SYSU T00068]|uniref:FAD binding domain-containing protein n=1 Tax=Demequina lignilytica TaxID=3051663 RepID=UPI0026309375|nr:FAD binding domain-containing protein [Demequina sp. SYSU T00068]MDN4490334.1 FAD binding domain-containing protein [Demequina sp. SYSU T00068]